MELYLHNSFSGKKEQFTPYDPKNVRMYVCGPTVYDRPHVGNVRAVVVYDVLYRILQDVYGSENVKYARNITDVDDKINARAKERDVSIRTLTNEVIKQFYTDTDALNNLRPTIEPRATDHIKQIIELCKRLIDNGHAYVAEGHVLFDVHSYAEYGQLSGKKLEDLIAGARIEVADYKKNAGDFVLWKPSSEDEPSWGSPWGKGRPGWHIECTAMINEHLGADFDIHGGGADLKFPHHENEIAQGVCAHEGSHYAKYWVHNGFVTVGGEKISKSLGNFTTVKDLLDKGIKGEVIRYVLISTHYRKPLDFNERAVAEAKKSLDTFYAAWDMAQKQVGVKQDKDPAVTAAQEKRTQAAYDAFFACLCDDMNVPGALSELYVIAKSIRSLDATELMCEQFLKCVKLLGILQVTPDEWFADKSDLSDVDVAKVEALIAERAEVKSVKNWARADAIRDELSAMGIVVKDTPEGAIWEKQ